MKSLVLASIALLAMGTSSNADVPTDCGTSSSLWAWHGPKPDPRFGMVSTGDTEVLNIVTGVGDTGRDVKLTLRLQNNTDVAYHLGVECVVFGGEGRMTGYGHSASTWDLPVCGVALGEVFVRETPTASNAECRLSVVERR
jgi:hypothetical protein